MAWQAAVAWGIWNDSTEGIARIAPANLAGNVALWGIDQRPIDWLAIVVAASSRLSGCPTATFAGLKVKSAMVSVTPAALDPAAAVTGAGAGLAPDGEEPQAARRTVIAAATTRRFMATFVLEVRESGWPDRRHPRALQYVPGHAFRRPWPP